MSVAERETQRSLRSFVKLHERNARENERLAHFYRERLKWAHKKRDWSLEAEAWADVMLRFGYSPAEVGRWIGKTRNAVIGKARRRGWKILTSR